MDTLEIVEKLWGRDIAKPTVPEFPQPTHVMDGFSQQHSWNIGNKSTKLPAESDHKLSAAQCNLHMPPKPPPASVPSRRMQGRLSPHCSSPAAQVFVGEPKVLH